MATATITPADLAKKAQSNNTVKVVDIPIDTDELMEKLHDFVSLRVQKFGEQKTFCSKSHTRHARWGTSKLDNATTYVTALIYGHDHTPFDYQVDGAVEYDVRRIFAEGMYLFRDMLTAKEYRLIRSSRANWYGRLYDLATRRLRGDYVPVEFFQQ
jgi:hypothetical protein